MSDRFNGKVSQVSKAISGKDRNSINRFIFTISNKTEPSSKAIKPIEKCNYAYSHLENKQVYGHQIIVSLLSCNRLRLPYSIDIYYKNHMSKIELSERLIFIGAIKTNRVLFPKSYERLGIELNNFVKILDVDFFNLVTVNKKDVEEFVFTQT